MTDPAAAPFWGAAVLALVIAVAAGIADHLRRKRADLDRVGMIDWRNVQMFALIATVLLVIIAAHD